MNNQQKKIKLVLGLGNPMDSYSGTRHNVGADFLLRYTASSDIELSKHKKAMTGKYTTEKSDINLSIFENVYMNESGPAFLETFGKKSDGLLVCHDDIDIPLGSIKISFNKNSGGHKGIESIMNSLDTKEFGRIRIGIGDRESIKEKLSDFVVSSFTEHEKEKIDLVYKKFFVPIVDEVIKSDLENAMNKYNKKEEGDL
ncbi:MAG: aminoacyl-tRNA hydrolase [Candidatus Campbellbacteria bacterium]|nr:aminoacyl-tRNA hydrolase [Candidatus Campbellbacteria bacterium]